MRWALLLVGVLLASACAAPSEDTEAIADLSDRITGLESEVAGLSDDIEVALAAPTSSDGSTLETEKAEFAAAVADPLTIANAIMEQSNGLVAVEEVRFDPITDSLVIRARGGEDAQQGAWQAAQAVAPLFAELDAYAPIVDLKVDDVRCACSTPLMKEIAAERVDRSVWESTCGS